MKEVRRCYEKHIVATREGGVDRNSFVSGTSTPDLSSPPARVAWIET